MSMTVRSPQQQDMPGERQGALRRLITRQVPWDVLAIWLAIGLLLALSDSWQLLTAPLAQTILMFPALFIFSGYAVMLLLFPGRTHLTGLERTTFAIIISSAFVVFPVLGTVFLGRPINWTNILEVIAGLTVAISLAALWRRLSLPPENRFLPWRSWHRPRGTWGEKLADLAIVLLAVAAVSALGYKIAFSQPIEHYTEFSIVGGQTGKANLPLTVAPSSTYSLTVKIKNEERRPMSYTIRISSDAGYAQDFSTATIAEGEEATGRVDIRLADYPSLSFLKLELFIPGSSEPYRELHLWLDQSTNPRLPAPKDAMMRRNA